MPVSAIEIQNIAASELTAEHLARWARLQEGNSELAHPFFRPEFTQSIATHCADVEIAVQGIPDPQGIAVLIRDQQ